MTELARNAQIILDQILKLELNVFKTLVMHIVSMM